MITLRVIADDLTGALDSAARFVPLVGAVPVLWHRTGPLPPTAAIDCGTRELHDADAHRVVVELAPALAAADIAFLKIDSLLRGHVAAALAACMRYFDHCVLAPAFPFQGRITRGGRQLRRDADGWRDVGVDLQAALRAHNVDARLRDAETDADLDEIVAEGRTLPGRVLWCGTGGLAGALAGHRPVPCPHLPRPKLALIGSHHPVAVAQLMAAAPCLHRMTGGDAAEIASLRDRLRAGAAAACVELPPDTPRAEAAQRINTCFATVLGAVGGPGTLVVAGGETLRGLCGLLGVTRIEVDGEVVPGVPTSLLRGGDWDGQRVVSKSGAFGDAGFLARLLEG